MITLSSRSRSRLCRLRMSFMSLFRARVAQHSTLTRAWVGWEAKMQALLHAGHAATPWSWYKSHAAITIPKRMPAGSQCFNPWQTMILMLMPSSGLLVEFHSTSTLAASTHLWCLLAPCHPTMPRWDLRQYTGEFWDPVQCTEKHASNGLMLLLLMSCFVLFCFVQCSSANNTAQ